MVFHRGTGLKGEDDPTCSERHVCAASPAHMGYAAAGAAAAVSGVPVDGREEGTGIIDIASARRTR